MKKGEEERRNFICVCVYVLSFFGFLFWYVPVCVFRDKRRARRERKREEEVVGKNLSTRH